MHHLWAEALAPLYAAGDTALTNVTTDPAGDSTDRMRSAVAKIATPVIFLQNHNIVMHHLPESAEISLISTMGQIVAHKGAVRSSAYFENLPLGKYIAVIRNGNVRFSKIVQVK